MSVDRILERRAREMRRGSISRGGRMQGSELMEEIMAEIKEHLLPTKDSGAMGNVHHYNRVWEKIEAWHNKHVGERTK